MWKVLEMKKLNLEVKEFENQKFEIQFFFIGQPVNVEELNDIFELSFRISIFKNAKV